jgi:hypothetical protein
MNVEPLGLVTGEAVGNRLEGGAHGIEMIEPLLEAEVIEIVGAELGSRSGIGAGGCGLRLPRLPIARR